MIVVDIADYVLSILNVDDVPSEKPVPTNCLQKRVPEKTQLVFGALALYLNKEFFVCKFSEKVALQITFRELILFPKMALKMDKENLNFCVSKRSSTRNGLIIRS